MQTAPGKINKRARDLYLVKAPKNTKMKESICKNQGCKSEK